MAQRVLKIVASTAQPTADDYTDPIHWLSATLKGNGATLDVLLRGNAVSYLLRPPAPPQTDEDDVAGLVRKGVGVFYLREDVAARGIPQSELIDGAQPIAHAALPTMLSAYDQIWHW